MAAVTVEDILVLPRVARPGPEASVRPVTTIVKAGTHREGAGFMVRRPFPTPELDMADPFLLFDHLGAVEYLPGEAKGAPWHPHRGFETVTYVMDGVWEHHDSMGGGGFVGNGSTQWMTAGGGILHDELPTQELVAAGGLFHGAQLWVNLPSSLKMVTPRYQDIPASSLELLTSHDGGALIRVIAGELDGHSGPGRTYTPITYLHVTISPEAQVDIPWDTSFNALVYSLSGSGSVGSDRRPLEEGHLAVFGKGDAISVSAAPAAQQASYSPNLEVLIIGGAPIHEPVVRYGPFAMNSKAEIIQAVDDYNAGKMGTIPANILS